MLVALKVEVPARRLAGVIAWRTISANDRPHGIDRAGCRNADLTHKRRAAITAASHAPQAVIDVCLGNPVEIGVAFQ
jgi:hypothetical protein